MPQSSVAEDWLREMVHWMPELAALAWLLATKPQEATWFRVCSKLLDESYVLTVSDVNDE